MEHRSASEREKIKGADLTDDSGTDQGFIPRQTAREKWGEKADQYEALLDRYLNEVFGKKVTYQGETALTVYHCISAGRTEGAENVWGSAYPYLVPVESVGDLTHENYISQKEITATDFFKGLATIDDTFPQTLSLKDDIEINRSPCGTVLSLQLAGKSFTGRQIRTAFSLRSANFDIKAEKEKVTFTVRGYGHLVGMSQFGAKIMAEQGSTFEEILTWYYKGCEVE
jgi:stage II sporulation protein D